MKKKKKKIVIRNIPKIGVEHTKSNGEFYFYLYPLGT
jgi:hypothetical protein